MANLLPTIEKQRLTTVLFVRVAIIVFAMWSTALVLIMLFILPIYIHNKILVTIHADDSVNTESGKKRQLVTKQLKDIKKEVVSAQQFVNMPKFDSKLYNLFAKIRKISGVRITSVTLQGEPGTGSYTAIISGEAPTRSVVVQLEKLIKNSDFDISEFPVTNFAPMGGKFVYKATVVWHKKD